MIERPLYKKLWDDLSKDKSMVFLSGPRQSGKTTLAKKIIARDFSSSDYFNWDIISDKQRLLSDPAFFQKLPRPDASRPLVILDEIHKYKKWKTYLKGLFDAFSEEYFFLVSGSGSLDISKKAGDALTGRFLEFHLFPFTIAELGNKNIGFQNFIGDPTALTSNISDTRLTGTWNSLAEFSGFPEPFLKSSRAAWQRWSNIQSRQIIREDIATIWNIKDIPDAELMYALLPSKVGSPLSINNIARDLQIHFETAASRLLLFELFFLTFRINPWTNKISRAILKEKKLYLYNYPLIDNLAARFENMVALELWRAVHHWREYGWGQFQLHYLRNKDKEEVDFLISERNKPVLLVETKLSDESPSPALLKFQRQLKIPAVQLVNKPGIQRLISNEKQHLLIVSAPSWLAALP
jgi:hypothetical protein